VYNRRDALVVYENKDDAAMVLSELAEFEFGGRTLSVSRVGGQTPTRPAAPPSTATTAQTAAATAAGRDLTSNGHAHGEHVRAAGGRSVDDSGATAAVAASASRAPFYYHDHGGSENADGYSSDGGYGGGGSGAGYTPTYIGSGGDFGPVVAGAGLGGYDSNWGYMDAMGADGSSPDADRASASLKKYGVWVGYFPEGRLIDRRALVQVFSAVGQVHSVVVPKDPVTSRYVLAYRVCVCV
jgi:hypothetical protein